MVTPSLNSNKGVDTDLRWPGVTRMFRFLITVVNLRFINSRRVVIVLHGVCYV